MTMIHDGDDYNGYLECDVCEASFDHGEGTYSFDEIHWYCPVCEESRVHTLPPGNREGLNI